MLSLSYLTHVEQVNLQKFLISVEEQKFAIFLPNVLNVDFDPRREGNIHTITLPQLNGITVNTDVDCCTGGSTGIVTGSLDEMCIDLIALGGVGDGKFRREDGGEDVK
jgi:hypothetical protein